MSDNDLNINDAHEVTQAVLKAHIIMLENDLGSDIIRIDDIDKYQDPTTEEEDSSEDVITLRLWDDTSSNADTEEMQLYIAFNALYTLLWPGKSSVASELAVERIIGIIIAPHLELRD